MIHEAEPYLKGTSANRAEKNDSHRRIDRLSMLRRLWKTLVVNVPTVFLRRLGVLQRQRPPIHPYNHNLKIQRHSFPDSQYPRSDRSCHRISHTGSHQIPSCRTKFFWHKFRDWLFDIPIKKSEGEISQLARWNFKRRQIKSALFVALTWCRKKSKDRQHNQNYLAE